MAIGGGLAGALFVGSIVFTVRALGAGGLTAVTIAGQLGLAVVIDHSGWLGVERSPITVAEVAGVALLALGTWLVISEQRRRAGADPLVGRQMVRTTAGLRLLPAPAPRRPGSPGSPAGS